MILKLKSNLLYTVSILSLVVPGSFFTIFLSSPINVFIYEDLPAFGRPTTENDGRSSEIKSDVSFMSSTNLSSRSPVPLPLIADIANNVSKPRL